MIHLKELAKPIKKQGNQSVSRPHIDKNLQSSHGILTQFFENKVINAEKE